MQASKVDSLLFTLSVLRSMDLLRLLLASMSVSLSVLLSMLLGPAEQDKLSIVSYHTRLFSLAAAFSIRHFSDDHLTCFIGCIPSNRGGTSGRSEEFGMEAGHDGRKAKSTD